MIWTKFRVGRTVEHLRRYRHIVGVLMKYGLDDLTGNLRHRFPFQWRSRVGGAVDKRSRPQRLRLALQELGPTFVKLGQLLSTRPDLLAPEYIVELEKLQDQVAPVAPADIQREIESQLGAPIDKLFQSFDPQPVAAGSVAQVHKALTHAGKLVAVKVRRPGIVKVIRTESEILQSMAGLLAATLPRRSTIDPVRIVHEFTDAVSREVNFLNELQNLEHFGRNFQGDPTAHVPCAYPELCAEGVLTMEFIEGIKPVDIAVLEKAGLTPKTIADRGAHMVLRQIFEFGLFHTDPHPGNLFILPGDIIAPIDFGQVARLTATDRALLADLILAIVDLDAGRLVRAFTRAGMLEESPNLPHMRRDLEKMLDIYHNLPIREIPFAAMIAQAFALIREHRVRPPVEFTMMLKSMMTIENLAVMLDPDFSLIEHLKPYAHKLNLEQFDPRRIVRRTHRVARDAAELLGKLPDDLTVILDKFRYGQFQMHVHHEHLQDLERTLDKSSNRISFSLIIAGLLIASSFLVPQNGSVLGVIDLQSLGVLGYLIAAVMGVWLLVSILRSRRL